MILFPAFLKLENRLVVIIGGGALAFSKMGALLQAGARIRVISPVLNEHLSALAKQYRIEWRRKLYGAADLDGPHLIIAATSFSDVNKAVYDEADRRGLLCNAVDDTDHCHFYYGSVVQRGDLQIAISTNGKSPALAQRIRKELEQQFSVEYAAWLDWLGRTRDRMRSQPHGPEALKGWLHALASQPMFEKFLAQTCEQFPEGVS